MDEIRLEVVASRFDFPTSAVVDEQGVVHMSNRGSHSREPSPAARCGGSRGCARRRTGSPPTPVTCSCPRVATPVLAHQVRRTVDALLGRHRLEICDVAAWAVHSGGPKVLDVVGERLGINEHGLDASPETPPSPATPPRPPSC